MNEITAVTHAESDVVRRILAESPPKPLLDLGDYNPREEQDFGTWVDVLRCGEKTGISFLTVGMQSATVDKLNRAAIIKYQQDAKRKAKSGFEVADPDDLKEANVIYVAACVKDFKGVVESGVAITFSAAAVTRILHKHKWILDQLDLAIKDEARFLEPKKPA